MKSLNNIVAVIVTYNGRKWIENCIESLLSSKIHVSIVVVDNCSTDGTKEFIIRNYPSVRVLENDTNLGFGQANNLGINEARLLNATHVLLVNQDVYIYSDTLENLLKYDDGVSLLSPIHLNGTGELFDYNFFNHSLSHVRIKHKLNISDIYLIKSKVEVIYNEFVNAAFWLIPICIINDVGGFNPLFFHYGEDNNYLHRVFYHGFKTKIVTDTYIRHDRIQFGNKKMFDKGQFYRHLLLSNCNINFNSKDLLFFNLKLFLKIIFYFISCDLKKVIALRVAIFDLFKIRYNIKISRTIEKKKGESWL